VNVTPLIDVSLVLVVMLLLATPLAYESSIGVNRTDPTARKSQQVEETERVEVSILSEDEVRVNRTTLPRAELEGTLRPLLAGTVPPPVVVKCADDVTHGTFVSVLDEAKTSGAAEIAVTEE
jgi:biopolymer transport protein ExbD